MKNIYNLDHLNDLEFFFFKIIISEKMENEDLQKILKDVGVQYTHYDEELILNRNKEQLERAIKNTIPDSNDLFKWVGFRACERVKQYKNSLYLIKD